MGSFLFEVDDDDNGYREATKHLYKTMKDTGLMEDEGWRCDIQ